MNLNEIRKELQNYEIKIIWAIIERSNFNYHKAVYNNSNSLFNNLLKDIEIIYEKNGYYNNPQHHSFTNPKITYNKPIKYTLNKILDTNHKQINHNPIIIQDYFNNILTLISNKNKNVHEDPVNIIKSDIKLLQLISNRCHLGKIVASIKVKQTPLNYIKCKTNQDIYNLLTNIEVEQKIFNRIIEKTKLINNLIENKINEDTIKQIFNLIIQYTKQIQINYIKTFYK
jgi:monofunctional chorismate mutase